MLSSSKQSTPSYKPLKDKVQRLRVNTEQSQEEQESGSVKWNAKGKSHVLKTDSVNSQESLVDKKNKKGKQDKVWDMLKKRTNVFEQEKKEKAAKEREKNGKKNWKVSLLDNSLFELAVSMATLFALFGDDFRLATSQMHQDIYFDISNIIVIVLFLFEIYITSRVRKNFLFSFFFWLDLVSSLTLIIDITFVSSLLHSDSSAGSALSFASVGRAGRVGTKAGRIVRIIKIFSILQKYKEDQAIKKRQEEEEEAKRQELMLQQQLENERTRTLLKYEYEDFIEESQKSKNKFWEQVMHRDLSQLKKTSGQLIDVNGLQQDESRVGKVLGDKTTVKTITVVLLLILVCPYFEVTQTFKPKIASFINLNTLKEIAERDNNSQQNMNDFYETVLAQKQRLFLIQLQYQPIKKEYTDPLVDIGKLRKEERQRYSLSIEGGVYDGQTIQAVIDLREMVVNTAIINICKTIFVALILTMGNLFFAKDVNELALNDINRMLMKVKEIATNPLSCKDEKMMKLLATTKETKDEEKNETILIERTITHIGELLALSFGELGSSIIAQNLAINGQLDLFQPGNKRFGIFGCIDIQQFTDVTDVLQEEVITYLNIIADLVHSRVEKFQGMPNKNMGSSFLLVWQVPHENVQMADQHSNSYYFRRTTQLKNIADLSLISFLKIIAGIHKKRNIQAFKANKQLNQRIPGFNTQLSFSLHFGWAIQGVIGSEYKIDASYLSPHINITKRMLSLSREYQVNLLLSSDLVSILSKKGRSLCRQIDSIKTKSFLLGLFTVDYSTHQLTKQTSSDFSKNQVQQYQKHQLNKQIFKNLVTPITKYKANQLFTNYDKDIPLMLTTTCFAFKDIFDQAFLLFLEGHWQQAHSLLLNCSRIKSTDGPTKFLLNLLNKAKLQSPSDWKGYRKID